MRPRFEAKTGETEHAKMNVRREFDDDSELLTEPFFINTSGKFDFRVTTLVHEVSRQVILSPIEKSELSIKLFYRKQSSIFLNYRSTKK